MKQLAIQQKKCSYCGNLIRTGEFQNHMMQNHLNSATPTTSTTVTVGPPGNEEP
jgi:hypothetical protein